LLRSLKVQYTSYQKTRGP